MPDRATPVELRKSPRARLHLPARIRWLGPVGMRLGVAETIDVSREGLLIRRDEPCNPLARVWVGYPFDPSAASIQPETPARIARVHAGEKILAKIRWGGWARVGEMTRRVVRLDCPAETTNSVSNGAAAHAGAIPALGCVAVEWANIER
jgi:hypothetical protein